MAAACAGTSLCISQSIIIVCFRANNDLGCRLYLKLDILTRLFKSLLLFWRTNQQPATFTGCSRDSYWKGIIKFHIALPPALQQTSTLQNQTPLSTSHYQPPQSHHHPPSTSHSVCRVSPGSGNGLWVMLSSLSLSLSFSIPPLVCWVGGWKHLEDSCLAYCFF